MIIYDRSKKTLFIPSGLGNLNSENSADYNSGYTAGYTDGRAVQESVDLGKLTNTAITENGMYIADYGFSVVDVNVESGDCSAAVAEAYQSGYTAGLNDCPQCPSGSCVLQNGSYELDPEWDGTPMTITPESADGFSSFTIQDTAGGYGDARYDDGYIDGVEDGFADGYSSGYTAGQSECSGSNLQYKNVEVNTDEMEVLPDSGYNGFSAIWIDATTFGNSKYSEGYADGQSHCPQSSACPLETKNIVVAQDEEDFYPDTGYAGFSYVHVDATAYGNGKYDNGYADGEAAGFADGYESGATDGYADGYESGSTDGFAEGHQSGYTDGYGEGYQSGYTKGQADCPECSSCTFGSLVETPMKHQLVGGEFYIQDFDPTTASVDGWRRVQLDMDVFMGEMRAEGYSEGYPSGYTDGHQSGYTDGYGEGYHDGYDNGFMSGVSSTDCSSAATEAFEIGFTSGYTDGYQSGYTDGHLDGSNDEFVEIRQNSLVLSVSANGVYYPPIESRIFYKEVDVDVDTTPAYNSGYTDGYASGTTDGFNDGFQSGYTSGTTDGFNDGHQSGYTDGYGDGYSSGYTDGRSTNCRMQEKSITLTSPYTSVEPDFGYAGLSYVSINGGSLYYNGYNAGSAHGYSIGYDSGYSNGTADGWNSGRQSGFTDGYSSGYTDGYGDGYLSGISATDCSEAAAEAYELGHQSGYTDGWNGGYTSGYTNGHANAYKEGEQSVIKSFMTGNDIGYDFGGAVGHDDYGLVIAYYYTPQGQNCVITGYHRDCDERWTDAFDSMSVDGGSWQAPTLSYWLSEGWHQIRFRVKDKYLHYAFCHNFPTTPDTGYMDAIVAVSLPESASTQSGITGLVGTFIDNTSIRILSSSLNHINSGTAQSQGSIYGATNLNVIFSHYQGNENVAINPVAANGVLFYPQGKSSTHANAASGWTHIELF